VANEEKTVDVDMVGLSEEESAALEMAKAMSMANGRVSAGIGLPKDFQGNYELFAVVTHKGRSADSGHYIGWARVENGMLKLITICQA
jgi:ubiquitin carboxyl-terminal hydrolase 14